MPDSRALEQGVLALVLEIWKTYPKSKHRQDEVQIPHADATVIIAALAKAAIRSNNSPDDHSIGLPIFLDASHTLP